MSLAKVFFGQNEFREGNYHPSKNPPVWLTGTDNTKSGVSVDEENIMGIPAVFSAVKTLSEDVGALPLILYNRLENDGKERARANPLYKILHDKPNSFMTAQQWIETTMLGALLRGNAYSQIARNGAGKIAELMPLLPQNISPKIVRRKSGISLVYENHASGETPTFLQKEIMHIRGMSFDGITGKAPVTIAREAFALAMAAEIHGAKTFGNGASLRGILKIPGVLKKDRAEQLRTQWTELYSGPENTGKTAVLEDGMEFQQISMSNHDAQFIESRKFQLEEIARIYRIPPHKIGHLEKATFSNIEHQDLEYYKNTLLPWLRRIEQAISFSLLTDGNMFAEFLVDAVLRTDIKTRYEAYGIAIDKSFMKPNEARLKDNMNPDPELDKFVMPMNMKFIGDEEQKEAPDTDDEPASTEDDAPEVPDEPAREAVRPIFNDALRRMLSKEANAKKKKNFNSEQFYPRLAELSAESFEPVVQTYFVLRGWNNLPSEEFAEKFVIQVVKAREISSSNEAEDGFYDFWLDAFFTIVENTGHGEEKNDS